MPFRVDKFQRWPLFRRKKRALLEKIPSRTQQYKEAFDWLPNEGVLPWNVFLEALGHPVPLPTRRIIYSQEYIQKAIEQQLGKLIQIPSPKKQFAETENQDDEEEDENIYFLLPLVSSRSTTNELFDKQLHRYFILRLEFLPDFPVLSKIHYQKVERNPLKEQELPPVEVSPDQLSFLSDDFLR